jgi:hypothetical protein
MLDIATDDGPLELLWGVMLFVHIAGVGRYALRMGGPMIETRLWVEDDELFGGTPDPPR